MGLGVFLLLGGLLGGLGGVWGEDLGSARRGERGAELEEEVSIVLGSDPSPPHCFSRTLHDLSCFWETLGTPDPNRFRLLFRLEQDPWQECPLSATALPPPGGGSRFGEGSQIKGEGSRFGEGSLKRGEGSPIRGEGSRFGEGSQTRGERSRFGEGSLMKGEGSLKRGEGSQFGEGSQMKWEGSQMKWEGSRFGEGSEFGEGSQFGGWSRFWCSLPPAAVVTFVPLELRLFETPKIPPKIPPGTPKIHPGTPKIPPETPKIPPETPKIPPETPKIPPGTPKIPPGTPKIPPETPKISPETPKIPSGTPKISPKISPETPKIPPGTPETPRTPPNISGTPPGTPPGTLLFQKILFIDQVVLPGPPRNVSVSAGGARGELCVRWAPPPGPYLHSSLVFELALRPPGGPPKTVGVPAGRREQGVGGLRGSTPYSVRVRARPDGLSYGGFWSPWSAAATASTPPDLDSVTLGLSCLLVLLLLGLGALGLLGHRRALRAKLWPPVPGPEREFEGLFSAYGGNFQLWLCQASGSPCAPPSPPPEDAEEFPSSVEELGRGPEMGEGLEEEEEEEEEEEGPPPLPPPPPPPPSAGVPSPSPSFEYTLFDPGSALLCPPPPPRRQPRPRHAPYANLRPLPKNPARKLGEGEGGEGEGLGHAPHYVICS